MFNFVPYKIPSDRELLMRELSVCADAIARAKLISALLGCHCEKLKGDGPIFCARGEEVSVGTALYLSAGCEIWDDGPILIGDCVVLGPRVKIRAEPGRPVIIGDRAWLGEGVEVLPGSRIGSDAVICAGTRVQGDVTPKNVIVGNPPQVLRMVR